MWDGILDDNPATESYASAVVIEWNPVYSILISVTRGWPLAPTQFANAALSGLFVLLLTVFCFIVPMEIGLRRLEEREIW